MSRSGYSSDCENVAMWRGMVASATRGKRGQKFFRDLLAALDAMSEKRLIRDALEDDGEVCAIGALGRARAIDMSDLDPECPEQVAPLFNVAQCLAQEVVYMNDEWFHYHHICHEGRYKRMEYTPEERWQKMRAWVVSQIRVTPEEAGAVESPDSTSSNGSGDGNGDA